MDELINQFSSQIEGTSGSSPEEVDPSSMCPSIHGSDHPTSKAEAIKVDQSWIERAINFSKAYSSILTPEEVDEQFKKSEFKDLSQFLNYNQLYYVDETYIKVASQVTVLKRDLVNQCFERHREGFTDIGQFLQKEGISQIEDCFYRVTPSFPKIKLLEIVSEIPWEKLSLPDSNFVDFLTLRELFQEEENALKIIVLGKSAGLWEIVDPNNLLPSVDKRLRKYFCQIQLGIEIDLSLLRCLKEWVQLNVEALQQKMDDA